MFLLRSAFWLIVAFAVIQPHGVDLGKSATDLGQAAAQSGRDAALNSISSVSCTTIECAGAQLIARSALQDRTSSPAAPAVEVTGDVPMPLPRLLRDS